jgi:hypothetical protein
MKTKRPWSDAHVVLKRMWDQHIAPTGMSQDEFGRTYGIGSQAMVSQYLLGTRPLNYDAAAKFAKGYGCSIEDICPEMARTLARDIFPVLRRRLRRAGTAVLALALTGLVQPDARAIEHNFFCASDLTGIHTVFRWLYALVRIVKLRSVSQFAIAAG